MTLAAALDGLPMTDKLTPPAPPDKQQAPPPSPAPRTPKGSAGADPDAGARGGTQPLNPAESGNQKPAAPVDPATQARLKKLLSDRRQARQEAEVAKKEEAPPPAGTKEPPPPRTPDTGLAEPVETRLKGPAWPAAAKALAAEPGPSTPKGSAGEPAKAPTGTERLNPGPPDPGIRAGAGLLDRLGPGFKTPKPGQAATGPLRPVPKDRLAQETWQVTFAALAGSEVKAIGVEVRGLIVVGRLDADSDAKPDLDLTPYSAGAHGVSRQHLILFLTDEGPCIMDLNSINGTWINGLYLEPGRKYRLRSGDRVELGSLKMLVKVLAPAESPGQADPRTGAAH
jgi:hypothetical protein